MGNDSGSEKNEYKLSEADCERIVRKAAFALYLYCRSSGIHFVVIGSSGGLDSAVTLGIAERACLIARDDGYDLYSVGAVLPCHSSPKSYMLGLKAIEKFNAKKIIVELSDVYDYIFVNSKNTIIGPGPVCNSRGLPLSEDTDAQILSILGDTGYAPEKEDWEYTKSIAQGNIKARLRMMLGTYDIARKMNGLVLSTDNLSEFWMAFWTICGDVGDYGMIQNVLKGLELYDIARYIGAPQEIINAKPDDGLGIAGGDEDQIGVDYVGVDKIMIAAKQNGFDPDSGDFDQLDIVLPFLDLDYSEKVIRGVLERAIRGAYKRHGPITLSRDDLGLTGIKSIKL